jgi:hypothetical protein
MNGKGTDTANHRDRRAAVPSRSCRETTCTHNRIRKREEPKNVSTKDNTATGSVDGTLDRYNPEQRGVMVYRWNLAYGFVPP